jgi:hypothetical protein
MQTGEDTMNELPCDVHRVVENVVGPLLPGGDVPLLLRLEGGASLKFALSRKETGGLETNRCRAARDIDFLDRIFVRRLVVRHIPPHGALGSAT